MTIAAWTVTCNHEVESLVVATRLGMLAHIIHLTMLSRCNSCRLSPLIGLLMNETTKQLLAIIASIGIGTSLSAYMELSIVGFAVLSGGLCALFTLFGCP